MSMNGVTGYNSYAYSNPYAYSNNGTRFQGYPQGAVYGTTATEEKDEGTNPLLAIGGVLAAAGGIAYAIKRGKNLNSLGDDAAKGLKGVWNNLTTGVKSIFTKAGREASSAAKQNTVIDSVVKQLGEDASKLDANQVSSIIEKQVRKANPEATADDIAKTVGKFIKKNDDGTMVIKTTDGLADLFNTYKTNNTNSIKNFFTANTADNVAKTATKTTANTADDVAKTATKTTEKATKNKTLTEQMTEAYSELEAKNAEKMDVVHKLRNEGYSIKDIKNNEEYKKVAKEAEELKAKHAELTMKRSDTMAKSNEIVSNMEKSLEQATEESEKLRIQNNIDQVKKYYANV